MAGTVTSNLTLITDAEAVTGWVTTGVRPTGTAPAVDTFSLKKQGTNCLVWAPSAAIFSAAFTITSLNIAGKTLYVWLLQTSINLIGKQFQGGFGVLASDGTNWGAWYVGGSEIYGNIQGATSATRNAGWICFAIDCDRAFSETSATAPNKAAITGIGVTVNAIVADPSGNAINNFFVDVMRHDNGLGTSGGLAISGGTTASPATFQDLYDADNLAANAYGIVRKAVGAFALQGPITIGSATAGTATQFTDTSQVVLWDDSWAKNTGIYGIRIIGNATAATNLTWGQFSGGVASKGISILSPGASLPTLTTTAGGVGTPTTGGYGNLSTTATSTITRSSGDWTKDGYVPGAIITTSGFTNAANNGRFHITAATATALTVSETTLVTEAAAATRTVTGVRPMRWDLTCTAAAGVVTPNFYACTFSGMGRATLISTVTMRGCTFSSFGDITPAGTTIDNCTFQDVDTFAPVSGTYALIINATTDVNSKITNSKFINCNRAFKITAAGSYTFSNLTFSGNTYDIENSIAATTMDSYAGASPTGNQTLNAGGVVGIAQSLTGNGQAISSGTFSLKKTGAPTGNAVIKIYAHSGTFGTSSIPTGAALATSDNINVANLTTAYVNTNVQFSGSNNITLTNATNYVMSLEYSGGDASNNIQVSYQITSATHAGNKSTLTGSTWTAQATEDCIFFLYSNANVVINATSGANPSTFLNSGNGSTTINNSVTVKVTVIDESGAGIQNVRVAIYKSSSIVAGTELILTTTDINGVVQTTFNYLVDTPITIRARLDSSGATRYFPYQTTGTITSNGFNLIATLIKDTIASP